MAVYTSLLHRLDAIERWRIYAFQLPLIAGGVREGLLVCIDTPQGETWGEISPYPGRSTETLKEALQQTIAFFSSPSQALFASVQFGLENALETTPFTPIKAPLYALLQGSYEQILQQAETAAEQGYKTIKVKLSPFAVQPATTLLRRLQKQFRLRIDCNSAYSMDEALSLFSPFDPACFDYIEDPTYERERLHAFTYPLALDETVSQALTLPLSTYPNLYGFILKPTLLGGKKGCAPYVALAKKHKLNVVFSSTFESGFGLIQILSLAKHFDLLQEPLGLDTHRYLQDDVLTPPAPFNTPTLHVKSAPQINLQHLTQIAHGRRSSIAKKKVQ